MVFLALIVATSALAGTAQLVLDMQDLRQVIDEHAADERAGSDVWVLTAPGGISADHCVSLRSLSAVRFAGGVSARQVEDSQRTTTIRFTGDLPAIVDPDWDPAADVVRGADERVPVEGFDVPLRTPAARTDLFDDALLVRSGTLRRVEQCYAESSVDSAAIVPLLASLGRDWVSGDVSISPAFSNKASTRLVDIYHRRITTMAPWITSAALSIAVVGFVFVRRRDVVGYLDVGFRRVQVVVIFAAQLAAGVLIGMYLALAAAAVQATSRVGISAYNVGRLSFAVATSLAIGLVVLTSMCVRLRTSDRRM